MISRRRVTFKCVTLIGATCLVLFVINSMRATSGDDELHRLLGREHQENLLDLNTVLKSRRKANGRYMTRTLTDKGRSKDLTGFGDIEQEQGNEWVNNFQLNARLQFNNELHQLEGDIKNPEPVKENVEIINKEQTDDEESRVLPVLIDGDHLQNDLDLDTRDQDKQPDRDIIQKDEGNIDIAVQSQDKHEAVVVDTVKVAASGNKSPLKNKTLPAKTSRKRVRVIRKTMRNGKVIHEEVVGIKTVITNENNIRIKGQGNIPTYDEIWYSDILNGNFKANPILLKNKTRESPYLTEKLWRFQDTNSERLFLYERLLNHGWSRNLTNLNHLRLELLESGIDAENNLIVTQKNAQLGSLLPFYISTKVPDGETTKRVQAYNVSAQFRQSIPQESPFRGKRYKRCAVIGNSGSLLNSGCGAEIDGFDMIFRCNAAPIDKYAHDAGWKSNITTFNPSIFYRRFNALKTKEDYLRFKENITQYHGFIWLACFGSAALHNVCLTPILAKDSGEAKTPRLVLSNPNQFVNFWEFWKTRDIAKTPSTGFFMTHASLELCEETHLYGFWPFPLRLDSTFERVPYHYFDDLIVSKRHGMSDEFSVFLQYHELGILRLHTGKCQREKT
ncbi:alpha-2,8-sialyltransferase 8F-like [Lytechinus pictus]|uniref:alpha-2,8-sialyltransferase 8F-like n=1 Tax=Lytechinus pictus TaxID=7653 RepID=UPI0030B9FCBB